MDENIWNIFYIVGFIIAAINMVAICFSMCEGDRNKIEDRWRDKDV